MQRECIGLGSVATLYTYQGAAQKVIRCVDHSEDRAIYQCDNPIGILVMAYFVRHPMHLKIRCMGVWISLNFALRCIKSQHLE